MFRLIRDMKKYHHDREVLFASIKLTYDAVLETHRQDGIDDEEYRSLHRELESQIMRYIKLVSRLPVLYFALNRTKLRRATDEIIDITLHISRLSFETDCRRGYTP